ncbi:MAG: DUF1573 domain-containing protein [Bacteroidales bacterium]|nr:DUF1573 domain-containing protein [Bacteroidales bacterium]
MNLIKIILLYSILVFSVISCKNKDSNLNPDLISNPNTAGKNSSQTALPIISFSNTEHDFGKIVDGVKVSYTFKFKNTGDADLIISQVKSSCGCTATKYTKEPIPPGGEGKVQLTFDSSNRRGFNTKVATVLTNSQPNTQILKISAMVVSPNEL